MVPDAIPRMKRKAPHTMAILGAMMACEQAKIPYQVLPENTVSADSLKEYDLILMPEVYVVSEKLTASLTEYVKNGGKLIASGRTGTLNASYEELEENALASLTGCSYVKEHNEYKQNDWSVYLKSLPSLSIKSAMVKSFILHLIISLCPLPKLIVTVLISSVICLRFLISDRYLEISLLLQMY